MCLHHDDSTINIVIIIIIITLAAVWTVLEQRVYHTSIRDVSHDKTRLVEDWQQFDQKTIDWAIKQWRLRLRSCIQQRGHFEHRL